MFFFFEHCKYIKKREILAQVVPKKNSQEKLTTRPKKNKRSYKASIKHKAPVQDRSKNKRKKRKQMWHMQKPAAAITQTNCYLFKHRTGSLLHS
jgi:hypothetical protein